MTPTATSTSAESNGTMVGVGEEREWEPLSTPDYAVLAFAGTWQVFALAVCVHLLVNRHWPPYVTKNVTLVIITVSSVGFEFCNTTQSGLEHSSRCCLYSTASNFAASTVSHHILYYCAIIVHQLENRMFITAVVVVVVGDLCPVSVTP